MSVSLTGEASPFLDLGFAFNNNVNKRRRCMVVGDHEGLRCEFLGALGVFFGHVAGQGKWEGWSGNMGELKQACIS